MKGEFEDREWLGNRSSIDCNSVVVVTTGRKVIETRVCSICCVSTGWEVRGQVPMGQRSVKILAVCEGKENRLLCYCMGPKKLLQFRVCQEFGCITMTMIYSVYAVLQMILVKYFIFSVDNSTARVFVIANII